MCFSTVCIVLALAFIGANTSEFPGGKLNFVALSFYFCENTSFSPCVLPSGEGDIINAGAVVASRVQLGNNSTFCHLGYFCAWEN